MAVLLIIVVFQMYGVKVGNGRESEKSLSGLPCGYCAVFFFNVNVYEKNS